MSDDEFIRVVHAPYRVGAHQTGYVLDAGSIHGVVLGSEFAIYASRDIDSDERPLTLMFATSVSAFNSQLSPPSDASEADPILALPCYAVQVSTGRIEPLRLHVPTPKDLVLISEVIAQFRLRPESGVPPVLVEDEGDAELSLASRDDGFIHYTMRNPLLPGDGQYALPAATKAEMDSILLVLLGASNFFWHSRRSPKRSLLFPQVMVEVYALKKDTTDGIDDQLSIPFAARGRNLLVSNILNVAADDETAYGIKLINNFRKPLHLWAFYFDCSDLSISIYHQPSRYSSDEPSLPAEGCLTMGYGTSGEQPFKYFLPPQQDLDIGVIKFFVSTQPVDLSSIVQFSPFKVQTMNRGSARVLEDEVAAWDVYSFVVVQRRADTDRGI